MQERAYDMPNNLQPTVAEVEAQFEELLAHGAMLQAEIDAGRGTPAVIAALAVVEAHTNFKFEMLDMMGAFNPADPGEPAESA
jgi:hypothetical protein